MHRSIFVLGAALLGACSTTHTVSDGGGVTGYDECSAPTDCIVVPESCCGSCGAATRGDIVAVNRDDASAFRSSVCGSGTACPACFMEPDPTLQATCNAGRCQVVDVQLSASTECVSDTDCRVRAAECCECGATITPSTVVAISDAAAFEAIVCDPGTGCPECAPVYPDTYGAMCDEGRCVAVFR